MAQGKRKIVRKEGFDWGDALQPHPMNVAISLGLVLILEFYILSRFALQVFPFEGATYMKARLLIGLMLFLPLWILSYAIVSMLIFRRRASQ